MSAMTSEITGVSIICLAVCSGADHRKHPRSESLAFVRGNPPFDDVIMRLRQLTVLMNLQTIERMKPQSSAFTVLCEGNTGVSSGFSLQKASNMESVSMSWRHHGMEKLGISHDACSNFLSCLVPLQLICLPWSNVLAPHKTVSNITPIATLHNRVLFCSPYIKSNTNLWYFFVVNLN